MIPPSFLVASFIALGAEPSPISSGPPMSPDAGPQGSPAWVVVLILLVGALVLVRSRLGRR